MRRAPKPSSFKSSSEDIFFFDGFQRERKGKGERKGKRERGGGRERERERERWHLCEKHGLVAFLDVPGPEI